MSSERVTVVLKYPIEFGKETIYEFSLRRPRGKDIRAVNDMKGSETAKGLEMIALLAGQTGPVVGELDVADMQAIQEVIDGFLSPTPPTGDGPSL